MVVFDAVLVEVLALAVLLVGWMTAWAPWVRVGVFGVFAASSTTMVIAGSRSTFATAVAATAAATSLFGLARMATGTDGPRATRRNHGTDLLATIRTVLWRRRRWERFERAFWQHAAQTRAGTSPHRSQRSRRGGEA
jgi:hypothetical protein